MRVAIFSDVHGNTMALEAALADIERAGGVDATWFVGDATALGYDPAGSVERLAAVPALTAVRGNVDRYVLAEDVETVPEIAARLEGATAEVRQRLEPLMRSMEWTRESLISADRLTWIASLPLEARVELPDGTWVLVVHASPGTDDGPGIRGEQSDAEVAALLAGADAGLVIVGRTHLPLDRTVDGVRVHNLGSVSVPYTDDRRAMWSLLEADERGYRLERRYAEYDIAAMLAALGDARHPAESFIRGLWDGR